MSKKKNDTSFLVQGSILAIASLVSRVIGLVYRIPLTAIIGDHGNDYYSCAYEIYSLLLLISSYSLPMAVSKMVSARISNGERQNAYRVFKGAMLFAAITGTIACVIVFFGAEELTRLFQTPLGVYALQVLAPTLIIVAVLGVFRGFFQGMGSMIPTAISQVIEQIVNAVISIAGAYLLFNAGRAVGKTRGDKSFGPAYAAAGGTLGTVLGALSALIFVGFIFLAYHKIFKKKMKRDHSGKRESYRTVYKVLFVTIAPVILSATVYNISDFVDTALFNNVMAAQGFSKKEYASLLGIFQGQYSTMINVPLSISSALAASLVPSLVATVQTGNRKQVHNKINTVSRFNMLIAIPCAVGFITLAKPILNLLYFTQDNTTAARMLQMGALSVVFFCLSTVTNSVLQGLDDMMTPVKNAAISLVIHIVTLFLMLVVLKWNIYAVVLSKIIFSGAICILNAKALRDRIGYVQEKKKTFLIPTLASLIMGVIAIVIHLIFELFAGPYIATIIALLAAVAAYGVSIVALGGITEEELLGMPKGAALVTICRRLHLIRGEYK